MPARLGSGNQFLCCYDFEISFSFTSDNLTPFLSKPRSLHFKQINISCLSLNVECVSVITGIPIVIPVYFYWPTLSFI